MKTLVDGHRYELAAFEGGAPQILQFIQKMRGEPNGDRLVTVSDGTTNEEVLTMLITRLGFLNALLPSRESSIALRKCEEALMWLNKRTWDRKTRGVEGTHKP